MISIQETENLKIHDFLDKKNGKTYNEGDSKY